MYPYRTYVLIFLNIIDSHLCLYSCPCFIGFNKLIKILSGVGIVLFFFLGIEFQLMASDSVDCHFLSSNQDTNRFLM